MWPSGSCMKPHRGETGNTCHDFYFIFFVHLQFFFYAKQAHNTSLVKVCNTGNKTLIKLFTLDNAVGSKFDNSTLKTESIEMFFKLVSRYTYLMSWGRFVAVLSPCFTHTFILLCRPQGRHSKCIDETLANLYPSRRDNLDTIKFTE